MQSNSSSAANYYAFTVDNFVTIFSPAEIRVAVVPVGKVPKETFDQYIDLIYKNRHVDLHVVNSFYHESGKSPFAYLPWKDGQLHFRFIQNPSLTERTPMVELHGHRRILGVIGVCHCQLLPDVDEAYAEFERVCKSFPDAHVLRCFAFEPKDADIDSDRKEKFQHLIMFPPGSAEIMEQHMEVVLNDFAACVMMGLEKACSEAKPPITQKQNSYMDTPHFALHQSTLEDVQKRIQSATTLSEDDIKKKKQFGRLRKFMGDCCMLAGSPRDAMEHYVTGIEMARQSGDAVWHGALLQALASSKVLDALVVPDTDVFTIDQGGEGGSGQKAGQRKSQLNLYGQRTSGGFGGAVMWDAIEHSGVGKEVMEVLQEARSLYKKRGAIASLVELDFIQTRFQTGLHALDLSRGIRSQVFEVMSNVVDLIQYLYLPQDRVLTYKGVADVMGLIGASRKRALMLWRASKLCRELQLRYNQFNTLQLAYESIDDPTINPTEIKPSDYELGHQVTRRETNMQQLLEKKKARAFHPVMSLLLRNFLDAAIYDGEQHGLSWDVAAALLREYCSFYNLPEQQSLLKIADEASSHLEGSSLQRQGAGLPPLVKVHKVHSPKDHLKVIDQKGKGMFRQTVEKVMLVDNLKKSEEVQDGQNEWVQGEQGTVELEVCNPCGLEIHLDRFGVMGQMEGLAEFKEIRMGEVQATIPPYHRSSDQVSSRVCLTLTPKIPGKLTLFGCRLRRKGVTWKQPFIRDFQHALAIHPLDQHKFVSKVQKFEVTVLPRMPILFPLLQGSFIKYKTKFSEPKSIHYSPLPPETIETYESTVMHVILNLKNFGHMPITHAQVTMGKTQNSETKIPGISNTSFNGVFGFGDQQSLTKKLPLPTGENVDVPLTIHIGNRLTDDQEPRLVLVLEYGSTEVGKSKDQSNQEEDDSKNQHGKPRFWRRMQIPFTFIIQRGPTIKKFEFKEEWVPSTIRLDENIKENGIQEKNLDNGPLDTEGFYRERERSLSLNLGLQWTPGGGRISCVLLVHLKNPTSFPIIAQLVNFSDMGSWENLTEDLTQESSVFIEPGQLKSVQAPVYPFSPSSSELGSVVDLNTATEKELKKEYNQVAQKISGTYGVVWKCVESTNQPNQSTDSNSQQVNQTQNSSDSNIISNLKTGFIPISQQLLKEYVSREVLSMVRHTSILVYFTMQESGKESATLQESFIPQYKNMNINRAVHIKVRQMCTINIQAYNGDNKEADLLVSISSFRVRQFDVAVMAKDGQILKMDSSFTEGLVFNGLVSGIQMHVGCCSSVNNSLMCCALAPGLYEVRAQVQEVGNQNNSNNNNSQMFRIRTQKLYVYVTD